MSDITPLFTVANQILVNFFDQACSGNYIAHEINDEKTGESYMITMQKIEGETPLYQLAALKEEHEKLKAEHANLLEDHVLLKLMYQRS